MLETSRDQTAHARLERWLALVSTVLLALAAVTSAWAGYQASRWHGQQAVAFARASTSRVESTRASGVVNRQVQIDVATFVQWVDAYARDEAVLAAFYRRRFRDEFKPAVDAWVATRPLRNPDAPLTPFEMPQYKLAASDEADRLEAAATAFTEKARTDVQRADNYVLAVVLLATSLFFAGISTRLPTQTSRAAILGLGCVVFVGTVVWLATFPTSVAL